MAEAGDLRTPESLPRDSTTDRKRSAPQGNEVRRILKSFVFRLPCMPSHACHFLAQRHQIFHQSRDAKHRNCEYDCNQNQWKETTCKRIYLVVKYRYVCITSPLQTQTQRPLFDRTLSRSAPVMGQKKETRFVKYTHNFPSFFLSCDGH